MNISLQDRGKVLLVQVDELQIGAEIAEEFKGRIRDRLPATGGRVAIDLSKVDFLDSSGLGALVSLLKIVRPEGELCLFGVRPSVQEILRLTHLETVFGYEQTEADALNRLSRALAAEDPPPPPGGNSPASD